MLAGCGSESELKLENYLEEIEFDTPLDSAVEVPLGKEYSIPIAARTGNVARNNSSVVWIQLKFHLYAVVDPENESAVIAAWKRNRGLFHDETLKICRSSTLDEIADSRLATIKSRLTDMARTIFGEKRIRQLLCTDISTEAI